MTYQHKYRWALAGFLILLLLNIGTLTTIWLIHPPQQVLGEREDRPRRVQRFLANELDLTPDQRRNMQELRRDHLEQMRPLLTALRSARRSYVAHLRIENREESPRDIDSLAKQIGDIQAEIERERYRHFRQIRTILDKDQRSRFDRLVRQSALGPPGRDNTAGRDSVLQPKHHR
ncbi:MAG: Spy/CpxP family protein refolding chaperone [Balneolaceae bacterium]|nr:Spy/CpxP family protein refolding chaperone [Balneolaceae bacterium]